MFAIELLLSVLAAPVVLACGYLLLLTLLSARLEARPHRPRPLRFDLIVPAHNEAAGIAAVVGNLLQLDWPRQHYRLIVLADNCTDATAARARAAGAQVVERQDPSRRGKGYALAHAFARSAADGFAEAVVVVDADSRAAPNLLEAIAARVQAGAGAVQVHYGVLEAEQAWRTRLMAIALGAIHKLRSRARERLGLSCGIRGNGWCVTHATLRKVPYRAYGLAEDVEYGIALGLAGIRVHYAEEAEVLGAMVSGARAARSQRQRWESGRLLLLRQNLPTLLCASLRRRSGVCLDLAADLLVLPLSNVVLQALAFTAVSAVTWRYLGLGYGWPLLGLACLAVLGLYVLRGWQLSGTGGQGLLDLMRAPWFLIWKLALMLRRRMPSEWVRTEREGS